MDRAATKDIFAYCTQQFFLYRLYLSIINVKKILITSCFYKDYNESTNSPIWIIMHKRAFRSYKRCTSKIKYRSENNEK